MTTKTLSFKSLPNLAIAEGATTPNPGQTGVWAWSTTLVKPVFWNGTSWSAGAAGGGGSGDVVGPVSSVDNNFPVFSGTTGKLLKASSLFSLDAGSTSGKEVRVIDGAGTYKVSSTVVNIGGPVGYSLNHELTYNDGTISKGIGLSLSGAQDPSIGMYHQTLGFFFNLDSATGDGVVISTSGRTIFKNESTGNTTLSIGNVGQLRIGNAANAGTSGQLFQSTGPSSSPTWTSLKTVNGNSLLGTGDIVISGGGGGGVTGPVSTTDNHLPVFDGTTGQILKEATYFDIPDLPNVPALPADTDLRIFARKRAGRAMLHMIGPSGVDVALQPGLFGNSISMWSPSTGTTVSTNFGTSWTVRNTGTGAAQAHPTRAATNALTSMVRATFGTGTTATGTSGVQSALNIAWRGNSPNLGGWFWFSRFSVETFASDIRLFVGLSTRNASLNADPSTINHSIGLCKDSADSDWSILSRSTVATKTPLTTPLAVAAGDILDLIMFTPPNATSVFVRVVNAVTGVVYADDLEITSNLPANNQFMYAHASIQSVTGTTAKLLALNRIYVETDL